MPKGTLRVFPISEHESVLFVRVANDTESDAHFVRRDDSALIRRIANMAASIGSIILPNGDMYAVSEVDYATA